MNSPSPKNRIGATLIPGDGIGPELAEAVQIALMTRMP
jgi:isocitrate/isopropylmalate dehydrogenase